MVEVHAKEGMVLSLSIYYHAFPMRCHYSLDCLVEVLLRILWPRLHLW